MEILKKKDVFEKYIDHIINNINESILSAIEDNEEVFYVLIPRRLWMQTEWFKIFSEKFQSQDIVDLQGVTDYNDGNFSFKKLMLRLKI